MNTDEATFDILADSFFSSAARGDLPDFTSLFRKNTVNTVDTASSIIKVKRSDLFPEKANIPVKAVTAAKSDTQNSISFNSPLVSFISVTERYKMDGVAEPFERIEL